MQDATCARCGGPAASSVVVDHSRLPAGWADVGSRPDGPPVTFCVECLQALRQAEPLVAERERQVLSGSLCALCHADLDDPPGGHAVLSRDGARLFRLCSRCRDAVESRRGRAP